MARTKFTNSRTGGKSAPKAPRSTTGGKGMFSQKRPLAGKVRKAIKKTRYGPEPHNRKNPRKNGLAALQDIKRWQKDPGLMIPSLPFARVVREIVQDLFPGRDYRMQSLALQALQEAAEATLVQEFELAYHGTVHAKRVTLQVKDMQLVRQMRYGMMGFAYPGGMGGRPPMADVIPNGKKK